MSTPQSKEPFILTEEEEEEILKKRKGKAEQEQLKKEGKLKNYLELLNGYSNEELKELLYTVFKEKIEQEPKTHSQNKRTKTATTTTAKTKTTNNIYNCLPCEGYTYNKIKKGEEGKSGFIPCKKSVISSAGMCERCRSVFIHYNGYIKYGFNNITGKGANPINKKERTHYPKHNEEYENNITNKVIKKFINIEQFKNYPIDYFPSKKTKEYYVPNELNLEEFEAYEKEQNEIFKTNKQ